MFINNLVVVGERFDMIGLIRGGVRESISGGGDYTINISGADLGKMFSEDGSSIYAQRFISSGKDVSISDFSGGVLRFKGKFLANRQFYDQPLVEQLLFIMDYQSRMRVCNSESIRQLSDRIYKLDIPEYQLYRKSIDDIWKIITITVDDFAANRKSFNSQIGNSQETLLSQMRKVCVFPFIELYSDTIGDRFHVIARKPLFDRDSVDYCLKNDLVINIKESDIVSSSLSYDETAYSWFRLDYKLLSTFLKDQSDLLLPAIYFEEFASIWGDKPYRIENPYIDITEKIPNDKDLLASKNVILQGLEDLKYVIESNIYLPFTRKGNIVLRFMRGIRRGTWVYCEGTDELCYVESVTHSVTFDGSVDGTTTVSVSRCMKKKYLDYYFGLVNMNINRIKFDSSNDLYQFVTDTMLTWSVNVDVFNLMVRRLL
jgi:hypothetical protein